MTKMWSAVLGVGLGIVVGIWSQANYTNESVKLIRDESAVIILPEMVIVGDRFCVEPKKLCRSEAGATYEEK